MEMKETLLNDKFFKIVENKINSTYGIMHKSTYYEIPTNFYEYPKEVLNQLKEIDKEYRLSTITKEEAFKAFAKLLVMENIAAAVKVMPADYVLKLIDDLNKVLARADTNIEELQEVLKYLEELYEKLKLKENQDEGYETGLSR